MRSTPFDALDARSSAMSGRFASAAPQASTGGQTIAIM
jgi:hypothetical protein